MCHYKYLKKYTITFKNISWICEKIVKQNLRIFQAYFSFFNWTVSNNVTTRHRKFLFYFISLCKRQLGKVQWKIIPIIFLTKHNFVVAHDQQLPHFSMTLNILLQLIGRFLYFFHVITLTLESKKKLILSKILFFGKWQFPNLSINFSLTIIQVQKIFFIFTQIADRMQDIFLSLSTLDSFSRERKLLRKKRICSPFFPPHWKYFFTFEKPCKKMKLMV